MQALRAGMVANLTFWVDLGAVFWCASDGRGDDKAGHGPETSEVCRVSVNVGARIREARIMGQGGRRRGRIGETR